MKYIVQVLIGHGKWGNIGGPVSLSEALKLSKEWRPYAAEIKIVAAVDNENKE